MHTQIRQLFISNFLGGLYFYVPIFALFLLNNDVSLSIIVIGQMLYSFSAFISEVPTGIIADRFGHNKSVSLGYFADAVGLLLIGFFPTVAMLMIIQILRGISGGLLSGSKEALLYEYGLKAKRNYKKDLSHLVSFQMLGFAVSTFLTGAVIQIYGSGSYKYMLFASFLAVLAAAALALRLKFTKPEQQLGEARFYELKKSLSLFKANKLLKMLFIVVGLTYGGKYLLIDLYQPYFEANNVLPLLLGLSLSLGSVFSFFMVRNVYRIEKPLGGPRLSLAFVAGLTGLLYVLFGSFQNPYALVVIFLVLFGVIESVSVFISDYANKHAPSDIRATVLSTVSLGKEIFKVGYKAVFAVAVGFLSISELFFYYGIFLAVGAVISYNLLGIGEKGIIDLKEQ